MAKRSLREREIREALETSDDDFSCDDSLIDENWVPDDSDTDSVNNIDIYDTEDDWDMDEDMDEDGPTELSNVVDYSETNIWTEFSSRQKTFTFTGRSGLQQCIPTDISCLDAFLLFVDNDVIELIVSETNKYAEEFLSQGTVTRSSRKKNWIPTTDFEMKKFLGLLLWMGLVKVGSLKDYWSKDSLYNFSIPGKTMSRNRFQLLLSFMHFSDNNSIVPGDRLGKITPLLDMLQMRYQRIYVPGENIVIDETLIPWRGRLLFRQYIPNKAHPYGIKLFKLCSTEGFTWSVKIYSGKSSSGLREVALAKSVCQDLINELKGEGRTLYVDNFYTSYELARSMLDQKTHVVGTLRANKKHFPKEVMVAPIKKGEIVAREDANGIVVLKWKDKRDVRMLSTKHAPIMVSTSGLASNPEEPSTSRGQRRKRRATEKPLAVVEYNKGKSGIDLSDQMASYSNTLRKGLKWYRKLGIELLLGLSVVNAFTVYKAATNKNINIRTFREHVAKDLLDLTSPQPVSQSKHIITKRVDDDNKSIRRACVLCYSESKKKLVERKQETISKRQLHTVRNAPTLPICALIVFQNIHILKINVN